MNSTIRNDKDYCNVEVDDKADTKQIDTVIGSIVTTLLM